MKISDLVELFKQTFKEWGEDKASRLAAALSYYAIFSLAPLLIIVISVAGLILGSQQNVQQDVLNQISNVVGPNTADFVGNLIANTRSQNSGIIGTIVGVVTLLVGATGAFNQLHEALNTIWEVTEAPESGFMNILKARLLSFTVVLGIGFLLLVFLVIDTGLAAIGQFASNLIPGSEFVWQGVNFLVSFGIVIVLFAMIYKILPDVKIEWRDVWLGASFTAFLFAVGKWVLGFYFSTVGVGSAYGAAGSLIVLLLWIYYSAQILFFGAEFTQVYANRHGSKIVPEDGAVWLDEVEREERLARTQESPETGSAKEQKPQTEITVVEHERPAQKPEAGLLHEAQPSVLAFSAVLAGLIGFISGMILRRRT
jgi:membrane protein